MADTTFGLSFSPLNVNERGYNNQPSAPNPVQEAIQILSLRRPTVVGAGSPVPDALLNAPGGSGLDLGALLQTLRRQYGFQYRLPRLPREVASPTMPALGGTYAPVWAPPVQPSLPGSPIPKFTFIEQPQPRATPTASPTDGGLTGTSGSFGPASSDMPLDDRRRV